jgi:TolA-binding protein
LKAFRLTMASQALTNNWLETAVSYGSTQWLQQFIRFHFKELQAGRLSPEDLAEELEQEFDSRRLTTPAQQKNYRSNVVMALKQLDLDHAAIPLVSLSTAQYRALNDEQRERVADRETRFIDNIAVERLVKQATSLLKSEEWADVGAGLAVLIGRRISEIILSGFTLKTPWSLAFSQMAKKTDDVDITIEIPTLAPAQTVLEAIDRLQRHLEGVNDAEVSSREAKRAVNRRYSGAIAEKCALHFGSSGLVPNRSDKDTLYTHIFRAVYATIAAHWYCPPNVPEHQFKAEIQGHFSITQEGKKLPNYSARSNYDDYAIGDGQGNRDGRLGIKLGQVKGLEVIEAFRDDRHEPEPKDELDSPEITGKTEAIDISADTDKEQGIMAEPKQAAMKRPGLYADDLERMHTLMSQRNVKGTAAEVFNALLDAFVEETSTTQKQQIETVGGLTQTLNWFTERISQVEQERDQLRAECDRFQSQQQIQQGEPEQVSQLKARNAQLEQELKQTQAQLNGIQQLLGGGVQQPVAPPPRAETVPVPPPSAPVPAATAKNQADQEKVTSTKKRSRTESTDKIADVIDAILKWNTAQERSDLRLRISFPSVKSLALLMGAGYQPAIKEVMEAKANEVDEIHERYMIGSRHNRSVQDKDAVLKEIARDYLGLPNWQEAAYTT